MHACTHNAFISRVFNKWTKSLQPQMLVSGGGTALAVADTNDYSYARTHAHTRTHAHARLHACKGSMPDGCAPY
jgi:hypothetical protein